MLLADVRSFKILARWTYMVCVLVGAGLWHPD